MIRILRSIKAYFNINLLSMKLFRLWLTERLFHKEFYMLIDSYEVFIPLIEIAQFKNIFTMQRQPA